MSSKLIALIGASWTNLKPAHCSCAVFLLFQCRKRVLNPASLLASAAPLDIVVYTLLADVVSLLPDVASLLPNVASILPDVASLLPDVASLLPDVVSLLSYE